MCKTTRRFTWIPPRDKVRSTNNSIDQIKLLKLHDRYPVWRSCQRSLYPNAAYSKYDIKCIWWWGSSPWALRRVNYSFAVISRYSNLTLSGTKCYDPIFGSHRSILELVLERITGAYNLVDKQKYSPLSFVGIFFFCLKIMTVLLHI